MWPDTIFDRHSVGRTALLRHDQHDYSFGESPMIKSAAESYVDFTGSSDYDRKFFQVSHDQSTMDSAADSFSSGRGR